MAAYYIKFKVHGCLTFPVDMLRYDHCHPTTPRSIDGIILSRDNSSTEEMKERRTVELGMVVVGAAKEVKRAIDAKTVPTVGRWASFGWAVSVVDVRRMGS